MSRFSRATLALYSNTGLASSVTEVLGLSPTGVHEKGDRRLGKNGREYSPYATSVWTYGPDQSGIDANDESGFASLKALLRDIGDRADALAALRPEYTTAIRWSGDVSLQGNFVIDAETIVALGPLGCDFYGTAYPEDGTELSS